jgi:hypothetical protein
MGFKVICVATDWIRDIGCENNPAPKFGDVDEVIDECWKVIDYYELSRFPGILFAKKNFLPISEIDETEYCTIKEKISEEN